MVTAGTPSRWRDRLPLALRGFLFTLIPLWIIGLAGLWVMPLRSHHWLPPVSRWLRLFARWDSAWYYRIAVIGYWRRAAYAFSPLYPLLMRGLHAVSGMPYVLGGELLGWAADLLALWLLVRLWREEAGEAVARRALWLLLAYPAAFFLVAMYPESLYLLLSVLTYLLLRRGRYLWAAVAMALAALSRANGILLILPYLAFAWEASGRRIDRRFLGRAALALIGVAGLGLYLGYSWATSGNPLQFLAQQATWHRHFTGGGFALAYALIHIFYGQGLPLSITDLLAPLAFLGVIAFDRGRLSLGDKLYVFFGVLSILVDPSIPNGFVLMSATRLVMPYFPVYRAAAERLSERQWRVAVGVMAFLQIWFWFTYTHWWFSG